MRVTSQTVAAQQLTGCRTPGACARWPGVDIVAAVHEELADYLGATVALLVQIDFAVLHTEHAKVRKAVADAHLRQDVAHQVGMQRIAGRKMSYVLFWHSGTLRNESPACGIGLEQGSADVGPDFSSEMPSDAGL